ncbi:hypothetical protein GXM18_05245 [Blautia producta ATCC 27340 = DSM 2950]|nr:hypothetical protein GXM18_05245 [Blautia producta ATCC 27340 = DSM 2950]
MNICILILILGHWPATAKRLFMVKQQSCAIIWTGSACAIQKRILKSCAPSKGILKKGK